MHGRTCPVARTLKTCAYRRVEGCAGRIQIVLNIRMKTTYSLLLLVIVAAAPAFAQTKMVAHKSHSGSAETFSVRGAGNFGETEEMRRRSRITKVIRISDTSAIEVYD